MSERFCERCYHWEQFGNGGGYCWVYKLPTGAKDTCTSQSEKPKEEKKLDISVPDYEVEDYRIPGEEVFNTRVQVG